MSNFKLIAQQTLSKSDLQVNRTKIEKEDVYEKELTIIAFDMVVGVDQNTGEDKLYPVIVFKELPNNYMNGGTLLNKLCVAWATEYNGDCAAASADLEASGGVKIRVMPPARGKQYANIDIL